MNNYKIMIDSHFAFMEADTEEEAKYKLAKMISNMSLDELIEYLTMVAWTEPKQ
ncbi:MAG TPA: hypothetical protein VIK78_14615 [Ruminiclostridium sp.]